MKRLCLIGSILTLFACNGGGDSTGMPEPGGVGEVGVSLTRVPGGSSMLFSASIQVADRPPFSLRDGKERTVSDVPEGTRTVEATIQTAGCFFHGPNPQTISVVANQLTRRNSHRLQFPQRRGACLDHGWKRRKPAPPGDDPLGWNFTSALVGRLIPKLNVG